MTRIEQLEAMLAERTDPQTGKPRVGYIANVAAIKAEIARLKPLADPVVDIIDTRGLGSSY